MTIEVVLWVAGLVSIVFVASRVMRRQPPAEVRAEEAPPRSPFHRPHYEARRPEHYALPPVTIETLPIDFKQAPEMVPPIDRGVLAALVASGSGAAAEAPRPTSLARGSVPPGGDYASVIDDAASDANHRDLDGAETLRPASDLDEDALTRTHMAPVR
jgi:hypothetical protein